MKELSIEQKAKRYNEAIKEAVIAHKDEDKHLKATLERIFPELKESEDERIRKELIDIVAKSPITFAFEDKNKVLSWLERQGEHANFINKIQIGDKVTRNVDGILVNLSQLNRVAKPADKVESKFKVGDWITNSKCTWKIDSIDEDMYYNNHCGIDCGGDIKSIDEEYHLWTIQDAKDGDILSDRYSIVIFRGIGNEKWKDVIDYHIGLFTNSQHLVVQKGLSHWGRINEVTLHPAIKEQRDTLMKAMADSGYEWDAEKKELKKIEQTPNDEIGNYDHGKVLDALMSAKKTPEPAWSEEDENIRQWIISDIKKLLYLSKKSHIIANKELDWLKSLKDRVQPQPKQEWSEEDEHYLCGIIGLIEDSKAGIEVSIKGKAANTCIGWLKSFKERATWKPSDEQMEALDDAIAICSERDYETECRLDNLRQNLKKLKEE